MEQINQLSLAALSVGAAAPGPGSRFPQEKTPLVCTFAANMDIYVW